MKMTTYKLEGGDVVQQYHYITFKGKKVTPAEFEEICRTLSADQLYEWVAESQEESYQEGLQMGWAGAI